MIYECDKCAAVLPAGVLACPKCGDPFEEAVPDDAEVPKKGFTARPAAAADAPEKPVADAYSQFAPSSYAASVSHAAPSASSSVLDTEINGFALLGILLLIGGLCAAAYFFLFFDTSVQVPTQEIMGQTIGGGRVNNLGLMADRQNGLIFGMGTAIVGLIIAVASRRK